MRKSDDPIYARKRRAFIKRHDPKAWRFDQLPPEVRAQWKPDEMPVPILTRKCRWCGEWFDVIENHKGNARHCSSECARLSKNRYQRQYQRRKKKNR